MAASILRREGAVKPENMNIVYLDYPNGALSLRALNYPYNAYKPFSPLSILRLLYGQSRRTPDQQA